jgi:hypothetical protein
VRGDKDGSIDPEREREVDTICEFLECLLSLTDDMI